MKNLTSRRRRDYILQFLERRFGWDSVNLGGGSTVIGGMLAASAIGIFVVPAIFYLVERWSGAGKEQVAAAISTTPSPSEAD